MDETKRCCKCGIEKPLSDFYKLKTSSDGYGYRCKQCLSDYSKEYYQKNKDNPERIELVKKYHSDWYEKNREATIEKMREYSRQYYQKNKDDPDFKQQKRRNRAIWRRTSPTEKFRRRQYIYRRRMNEKKKCTLTLAQWNEILAEQDNKCKLCGVEFAYYRLPTKDHIIPLSKGGEHTKENIQALCMMCNSLKGDHVDE